MHGAWKRRQQLPRIGRRVVCLERAERRHDLARDPLAAADVDAPVVGRVAAAAARSGHALLHAAPLVRRGVVLLDDVGVAAVGDHAGGLASADDVDLVVHHADKRVIAGRRHRTEIARPPRVRHRIEHLVPSADAAPLAVFKRLDAADQVHLAGDRCGHRGAAWAGNLRHRAIVVGRRVVLPHVGDRIGAEDPLFAAAEDVDFVVVDRLRLMMDALRQDLFLGPLVRARVVLIDEPRRIAERHVAEAADHVHFAVDRDGVELLFGLGERRRLHPAQARRLRRQARRADGCRNERDSRDECK